ncbi:hemoglobin/transferrin/lactoferrin receptor protein [Rhodoligotrophos appendicifer]|uniref:TonB-dependent hemoglobin/transferrin/lactoferrin family receptor n=1 Tax=Rhodoligotrophos appendicifer TaxID=987056 RepID=UPI0011857622|nr:TonB-dependent hemoglobin/transferrin/lactoferrin family receptor [Rhodoligotrophos appendicifer]
MSKRLVWLRRAMMAGVAMTALTTGAHAQMVDADAAPLPGEGEAVPADYIALDEVTVVPGRIEEAAIDSPTSTSVVTEQELQLRQAETLGDVFRGMPGVTAVQDKDQPGGSINIRGLQDFGRVAVIYDGARQNFQVSKHNGENQLFIEPELLKQVTVVRGPVANTYGSGAIGGVVSFETKDARDLLAPDQFAGGMLRGGYETNGDGYFLSGTGALQYGNFDTIGNITYRNRGNYQDGKGDTVAGSAFEVIGGLLKASYRPAEGHEIKVGYIGDQNKWTDTFGTARKSRLTNNVGTVRYTFDDPTNDLWNLSATGYISGTNLHQENVDELLVDSNRKFNLVTTGTDVYNTSIFQTGFVGHTLTYGGDFFHDDVTTKDSLSTGDLFTPGGKRDAYGAYIQDKLTFFPWLEVIGAGRFDGYALEGKNVTTGEDVDNDGTRISPKVTVAVKPFHQYLEGLQFYGTYAEGYRAPSVTETLISGIHPPPAPFPFLPNPDLKPEVGHTLEAGINFKYNALFTGNDALRIKTAIFQNDVDDMITLERVSSLPFPFGTFQYTNIAEARIRGFEFEGMYDAGFMFAGLSGQIMRGKDQQTDEWVDTIPPDQLTGILGFRFLEEALEVGTEITATAKQDRVTDPELEVGAYTLVDLFVGYQLNRDVRFDVRFNNILDETYRPFLDQDNMPGFNTKFAMTMKF